jgi:hypothetical protein
MSPDTAQLWTFSQVVHVPNEMEAHVILVTELPDNFTGDIQLSIAGGAETRVGLDAGK